MKYVIALFVGLLVSAQVLVAGPIEVLNKHLDERIQANITYSKSFAEDAKETKHAKKLVPLEKQIGKEWGDYLRYVKKSKDVTLKAHVLKLDLLIELSNSYYDLESAEGVVEQMKAKAAMEKWEEKLKEVKAAVSEHKKKK